MSDSHDDDKPVVLIAVMGATGAGKSQFINLISGSNLTVGNGLMSCTGDVEYSRPFDFCGRQVVMIDTPGFDDTTKSDTDILKMIAHHLETTYAGGIKLSGIIYLHRISDVRMTGVSRRNFSMFRKLCGDKTLANVVIVTTWWQNTDPTTAERREEELQSRDELFKPVFDKGARMMRHDDTYRSAQAIIRTIVNQTPQATQIQEELVDQGKNISQTAAAVELNEEIARLMAKHERDMQQLKAEMAEVIRARDEEAKRELEEARRDLQAQIKSLQQEHVRLVTEYGEEKKRIRVERQRRIDHLQVENDRLRAQAEEDETHNPEVREFMNSGWGKGLDYLAKTAFAIHRATSKRRGKPGMVF
ncbi:hypothetical protein CERSUDRAFT_86656 [Gelatoporia subvermispora B]|uniref:G domain-containing protein n=1 Tax=Ceriporiopsis subvermispora (strain B) TaxID=914234 RepID=M2QP08_CERS8|nr:hypothetical protein CERSUDRAFT_86656 [Gelatoporia subvermispora B]